MNNAVTLHPQHELTPGRYLLDREGRLHPDRYRGFIRAVAAVTVKCKPPANIEDEFVVVTNVDKTGLPLQPYTEVPPAVPVMAHAIIEAVGKPAPLVMGPPPSLATKAVSKMIERVVEPPKPALAHPDRGRIKPGPKPKAKPRAVPDSIVKRTKADGFALFDKVTERIKDTGPARARRIEKPAAPFDPKAYAKARERERQAQVKKDAIKLPPMVRALSPEACSMCGASGRNGCDHYLPFEG